MRGKFHYLSEPAKDDLEAVTGNFLDGKLPIDTYVEKLESILPIGGKTDEESWKARVEGFWSFDNSFIGSPLV